MVNKRKKHKWKPLQVQINYNNEKIPNENNLIEPTRKLKNSLDRQSNKQKFNENRIKSKSSKIDHMNVSPIESQCDVKEPEENPDNFATFYTQGHDGYYNPTNNFNHQAIYEQSKYFASSYQLDLSLFPFPTYHQVSPDGSPFIFRPCVTYTMPQSGYNWLANSNRGHRQGQRRPWYGGEGISYDRWPSRRKPCEKIKMELENQMAEPDININIDQQEKITLELEDKNQCDALEKQCLLPDTSITLNDAANANVNLNFYAEDLVDSLIKESLNPPILVNNVVQESADDFHEINFEKQETDMDKNPSVEVVKDSFEESHAKHDWTEQKIPTDDINVRRPFAAHRDITKYYKLCSSEVDDSLPRGGEIIIHELDDDASECGSEDVEMFGHRYETAAEKRYKNNQVSLANEILSAGQQQGNVNDDLNLPPISIESEEPGCYTNTQMLEGYYGQMKREPKRRPVSDVLDSGIHTSDDDEADDSHARHDGLTMNIDETSADDEVLFARNIAENDNFKYQPFGTGVSNGDSRPARKAERTPLVYLKHNPWYYGCCSVM